MSSTRDIRPKPMLIWHRPLRFQRPHSVLAPWEVWVCGAAVERKAQQSSERGQQTWQLTRDM